MVGGGIYAHAREDARRLQGGFLSIGEDLFIKRKDDIPGKERPQEKQSLFLTEPDTEEQFCICAEAGWFLAHFDSFKLLACPRDVLSATHCSALPEHDRPLLDKEEG